MSDQLPKHPDHWEAFMVAYEDELGIYAKEIRNKVIDELIADCRTQFGLCVLGRAPDLATKWEERKSWLHSKLRPIAEGGDK